MPLPIEAVSFQARPPQYAAEGPELPSSPSAHTSHPSPVINVVRRNPSPVQEHSNSDAFKKTGKFCGSDKKNMSTINSGLAILAKVYLYISSSQNLPVEFVIFLNK